MRRQVRRTLELDADRAQVWRHVSDPERLGAWLGGRVEVRLLAGERGRVRWADGRQHLIVIDEVVAPRRLRWLWQPLEAASAEPGAGEWSLVTVLLDVAAGRRSLLTVTEFAVDDGGPSAPLGFSGGRA